MGLTDDHLAILREALETGGLTLSVKGAPLFEGMVSMKVLTRCGRVKNRNRQYYLVTRAGEAAYERQQSRRQS